VSNELGMLADLRALPWRTLPIRARVATIKSFGDRFLVKDAHRNRLVFGISAPCAVTLRARSDDGPFELTLVLSGMVKTLTSSVTWRGHACCVTIDSVPRHVHELSIDPERVTPDRQIELTLLQARSPTPPQYSTLARLRASHEELRRNVRSIVGADIEVHVEQLSAGLDALLSQCCWTDAVSFASALHETLASMHRWAEAARAVWWIASYRRVVLGLCERDTIGSLGNLAIALKETGQAEQALLLERVVQRALEGSESAKSHDRVMIEVELGNTLRELGRLAAARARFDAAHRLVQDEGVTPELREIVITTYAGVLHELGDWARSVNLMRQVLASREGRLAADDIELQRTRTKLAAMMVDGQLPEDAAIVAEQAYRFLLTRKDVHTSDFVSAACVYSGALATRGNHSEAERVLVDALVAMPKEWRGRLEHELAELDLRRGDAQAAIERCERAHGRTVSVDCAVQLLASARLGRVEHCREIVIARLDRMLTRVEAAVDAIDYREADLLCRELRRELSAFLSMNGSKGILAGDGRIDLLAFELVCILRSLPVFIHGLDGSRSSCIVQEAQESSPSPDDTDRRNARASGQAWLRLRKEVTPHAIARRVGQGSALVVYHAYDESAERHGGIERMLAFVLLPDGSIRRIELGPLDGIDRTATEFLCAIEFEGTDGVPERFRDLRGRELLLVAGEALGRLVLDPVLAVPGTQQRLWVLPDEILTMVPFDSVPTESVLACERYDVHMICTALPTDPEQSRLPVSGARALLVGDLDYDQAECASEPGRMTNGLRMQPLSGTRDEIRIVDVALSSDQRVDVDRLTGRECCRHALLARVRGRHIVHLATHGHGEVPPRDPRSDEGSSSWRISWSVANPLEFVMIALSGANSGGRDVESNDGLLSGLDIVQHADLSDARLCFLSACSLSTGVRSPGIGTASVQMACLLAGCGCVIGSTVTVPDHEIAEFARDFYFAAIGGSVPLREAYQTTKLLRGRDLGLPLASWAGWIFVERGIPLSSPGCHGDS
jgi:hypothetical protein